MARDAKGRSTGELSEIREVSRPGTWPDGAGSADLLDHERCEGHGAGNHQNAQREVVRCGHFERGYERGCLVRERRLEHFNDGLAAVEVIDRREVSAPTAQKQTARGFRHPQGLLFASRAMQPRVHFVSSETISRARAMICCCGGLAIFREHSLSTNLLTLPRFYSRKQPEGWRLWYGTPPQHIEV
jgi:hypothetical protein